MGCILHPGSEVSASGRAPGSYLPHREQAMTTTLEPTSNEKPENSAPYTGGQLLCELLEAVEGLENHVLFGARELDDTDVVVQVFTNLAMRIRKQAVAEGLVQS